MRSKKKPGSSNGGAGLDTLRLSDRDRQILITQLDLAEHFPTHELRGGPRVHFVDNNATAVEIHHPGGTYGHYQVWARNMSRTGMAFLHGGFLYVGTQCWILLSRLDGQGCMRVPSTVVRCRHVSGHAHEVAVRFGEPIPLNKVAGLERGEVITSDPLKLCGRVLYISDSLNDQALIKFQLDELGLNVRLASNGPEGLTMAGSRGFDLVMVNVSLPGMSGPETAAAMREQGYRGPILALTSDEREQIRIEAAECGCTRLLVTPLPPDQLGELLREYLRVDLADEPNAQRLVSEYWSNVKMRPLILAFLARLEEQVRELGCYVTLADCRELVEKLCLDLKGSAGGYGYAPISAAAQSLLQAAMQGASPEALGHDFAELQRLCGLAVAQAKDAGQAL